MACAEKAVRYHARCPIPRRPLGSESDLSTPVSSRGAGEHVYSLVKSSQVGQWLAGNSDQIFRADKDDAMADCAPLMAEAVLGCLFPSSCKDHSAAGACLVCYFG